MGYDLNDFNKDVVEASQATPVVIDFWADWCGPCKQLTPVLEKLASAAKGRWKLVKIDTEQHPQIASYFNIRGIPAVKMVYQKEVIAQFTGAQPEHQVKKWLADNLPGDGGSTQAGLLEEAESMIAEDNRSGARELFREHLDDSTDDAVLAFYAMLLLPDKITEAEEVLDRLEDKERYEMEFQALETIRRLSKVAEGAIDFENRQEESVKLYIESARSLFDHKFEEAISGMINCLQIDRNMDEEGPRKACVAIFNILTDLHPLSAKYRRQFSMALY